MKLSRDEVHELTAPLVEQLRDRGCTRVKVGVYHPPFILRDREITIEKDRILVFAGRGEEGAWQVFDPDELRRFGRHENVVALMVDAFLKGMNRRWTA